jgi:CHASE2 domain-containing sensor protein
VKPKPRVPIWRWGIWWLALAVGTVIFYVLLTPIWLGLRWAAWIAEFRARRRPAAEGT